MYKTELDMSRKFERFLRKHFGASYVKEYEGLFGIPDFIFYNKEEEGISIISFELKLRDWKRAAKQAFKYKSFSHMSYVVIPSSNITTAEKNINTFKKYNIGLIKFDDNNLDIIFKPHFSTPFSKELNVKVQNSLRKSRKKSKNFEIFWEA